MTNKKKLHWIVWVIIILFALFVLQMAVGVLGFFISNPIITLVLVVVGYFIYQKMNSPTTPPK